MSGSVSVFVVLAITLAVAATGAVAVAGLQLLRASRRLQAGVKAAAGRLQPLTEELQDEAAVTAVELEALQGSVERLATSRRTPGQPAQSPLAGPPA